MTTPPPPISTSTSPFQVYPPFVAKNFVHPLVTKFSEGPTPFPLISRRGGGGRQCQLRRFCRSVKKAVERETLKSYLDERKGLPSLSCKTFKVQMQKFLWTMVVLQIRYKNTMETDETWLHTFKEGNSQKYQTLHTAKKWTRNN